MSAGIDTSSDYYDQVQGQTQPSEDEYEQLQTEFEHFLLPSGEQGKTLHLHECQQCRRGDNVDEPTAQQLSIVKPKPTTVYPYGYYDVCSYCLTDYENREINNDE